MALAFGRVLFPKSRLKYLSDVIGLPFRSASRRVWAGNPGQSLSQSCSATRSRLRKYRTPSLTKMRTPDPECSVQRGVKCFRMRDGWLPYCLRKLAPSLATSCRVPAKPVPRYGK